MHIKILLTLVSLALKESAITCSFVSTIRLVLPLMAKHLDYIYVQAGQFTTNMLQLGTQTWK
jgi:hypothetical protein